MTDYIFPGNNLVKFDAFNMAVTANTNIINSSQSATVNPYGGNYVTTGPMSAQNEGIFVIYLEFSGVAQLAVVRTQTSTAQTVTGLFAAEVAQQPNWHSIAATQYEQLNFQVTASITLNKFTVMEVSPIS
jgi:hypothetical protein